SIPAHPSWFQNVLALERKAVEIREYQMVVLPGLLQTEDYARSLIRPAQPWANAEKVDELVHARMSRREILTAPDRPLCWFVVDQVVIDRVTGSPTVMKEQLTYLLKPDRGPHDQVSSVPARNPPASWADRADQNHVL
ncbi:MAG: DUF5753 domain-containing protein, partial [Thermobifida fusca]|nr:DUF5753 domain-containing protein [Thermobifida fusca]